MIRDFLRWWGQQLASLLPQALRGRSLDERRMVVVALASAPGVQPLTVDILLPARGRTVPARQLVIEPGGGQQGLRSVLARAPRAPLCLRLPPGMLLERDVTLPLAAEKGLDSVLRYELDRLTPFRAADALWSWTIERRDRTLGRLHLRLTVAGRAQLAPLLTALAEAGRNPVLIEAPGPLRERGLRRLDLSGHPRATGRNQRFLRLGIAACAALACAAILLPFLRQTQALDRVEAQIALLQPRVAEEARLRAGIEARSAGTGVLAAEGQEVGNALQTLAAVTDALPDGTWLTDLTLDQRQLRLDGESGAAVQLITRLAAQPGIVNPAFTAPVTTDERTHAAQFSIGAEMQP